MLYLGPIQWHNFQADLIWPQPDGTYNINLPFNSSQIEPIS